MIKRIHASDSVRESQPRRPAKWLTAGADWGRRQPPPIDFQMHTTWTDGRSSTADMIAAAKTVGLRAIAITEHVNLSSDYYPHFVGEVRELRQPENDLEIYYGVEAAACDYQGGLKTRLDPQKDAEWALGVVHRYPNEEGGFYSFDELSPQQALELELKALEGLAAQAPIDVLGHPGGTYYRKYGPFPVERMATAFALAKENDIAVEFNTRYCWDVEGFIDLLRTIDPLVSFGSDAHCAADVGSNVQMFQTQTDNTHGERGA